MKLLLINTWYKEGSTGKLVQSLYEGSIKNNIDTYVIFGRGDLSKEDKDSKKIFKNSSTLEAKLNSVISRISGIMYSGCFFSTIKMINLIKKINPDVIHIHCTNSFIVNNYKLFKYLGENNYKVVITLHAEFFYTGSCGYAFDCKQWIDGCNKCPNLKYATRAWFVDRTKAAWEKMHKALSYIKVQNRTITAVSSWLKDSAKMSKTFGNDDIVVVNNGIKTNVFKKYDVDNRFRDSKDQKIIFYATPSFNSDIDDIKGGYYLLKIAEAFKDNPNYKFIIAGGNRYNFDFSGYKNVQYLGNILDQEELANLYSMSDLTLMLSKMETYSLVTAESISCGTRVVGFKAGGPESIAVEGCGTFFEYGDIDSVVNYIKNYKHKESIDVGDYYSEDKMVTKYLDIYNKLYNR